MQSLSIRNLNVWYGNKQALKDITLNIPLRQITAIIGPSGCGKSTLLKSLNRLLDLNEQVRVSGQVLLDGVNIYDPNEDVTEIRTRIGLLAQKPFPLPLSIYDNVAYGPRIHGRYNGRLDDIVQSRLESVGLWDEVHDRLKAPATALSVGQQQRLCLARSLAVEPEILLCDESTSSLDPISARGIEALLRGLKQEYTVIMVTHDIDQARRLADHVAFMWLGELVEHGPAESFFAQPHKELTQAYLAREIG
ncbi:MAG: phosphate ABC transporter ATP-binding protein [Chloroflexota bacterium]